MQSKRGAHTSNWSRHNLVFGCSFKRISKCFMGHSVPILFISQTGSVSKQRLGLHTPESLGEEEETEKERKKKAERERGRERRRDRERERKKGERFSLLSTNIVPGN